MKDAYIDFLNARDSQMERNAGSLLMKLRMNYAKGSEAMPCTAHSNNTTSKRFC